MSERILASYKFLIIGQLMVILGALICYYTSFRVAGFVAIALGIIMVLYHFYLEVIKECLSLLGV